MADDEGARAYLKVSNQTDLHLYKMYARWSIEASGVTTTGHS